MMWTGLIWLKVSANGSFFSTRQRILLTGSVLLSS